MQADTNERQTVGIQKEYVVWKTGQDRIYSADVSQSQVCVSVYFNVLFSLNILHLIYLMQVDVAMFFHK